MDQFPTTLAECYQVIKVLLKALDDLSKRVQALEMENRYLIKRASQYQFI
jgi:hypothetical protein